MSPSPLLLLQDHRQGFLTSARAAAQEKPQLWGGHTPHPLTLDFGPRNGWRRFSSSYPQRHALHTGTRPLVYNLLSFAERFSDRLFVAVGIAHRQANASSACPPHTPLVTNLGEQVRAKEAKSNGLYGRFRPVFSILSSGVSRCSPTAASGNACLPVPNP